MEALPTGAKQAVTVPSPGVFVGRHKELGRLRRAAADARAGCPSVQVIEGLPGMGKTALLRHFLGEMDDFTVIAAAAGSGEETRPYALMDRLTTRFLRDEDHARFPALRPVGTGARTPLAVGADILRLLDRRQQYGPLALVLDNADWADPHSLQTLAFALQRLWRERVLTLVAVHSWPPPWEDSARQALEGVEHFKRLTLSGLSRQDVEELTVAVRGRALPTVAAEHLAQRTGGHPLYVRTLLTELPPDWEEGALGDFPMPADLTTAVERQVGMLPVGGRSLVEALAVLNEAASLRNLAEVAGLSDAIPSLKEPIRVGLVEQSSAGPTGAVSFRHALQREAVYQSLSPERRRRLHARAAAVLDPRASLMHRVAVAEGAAPALAEELCQVSIDEARQGRLATAATWLRWAAHVAGDEPERLRMLVGAARLSFWAGQDSEALRHHDEITASAPSALRDEALAFAEFARGRPTHAYQLMKSARGMLSQSGDAAQRAAVVTELAAVCALLAKGSETEEAADEALAVLASGPAVEGDRDEPWAAGIPPGLVGSARCLRAFGHALRVSVTEGLKAFDFLPSRPDDVPEDELAGLLYRGLLRGAGGRFAGAGADLMTATARTPPGGIRILGLGSRIHLALCHFMSGDWAQAARDTEIGLSLVESRGSTYDRAFLYSLTAGLEAVQGRQADAQRHLDRAIDEAQKLDYVGPYFHIALSQALLARCRNDHEGVLIALRNVSALAAFPERSQLFASWWQPFQVEALLDSGRVAEAESAYAELLADGVDPQDGLLTVARAWLCGRIREAQGDPRGALASYTSGVAPSADRQDAPLYRGLLEQHLGTCLAGLGQTQQALAHLRTAENTFAALGAVPFLRDCRSHLETLDGAGLAQATVLDGLTMREREVALLVGTGRTNREIADTLYLSVKTIEYHLRNIFTKLKLHSRRELRDRVQEA